MNAQKSLLEQDLALTWRYSVGNPYEEFSFAESLDVAEVMGSYGFTSVMRQILRTSFRRFSNAPSNWRMGELMIASARYYELTGDRPYLHWVHGANRRLHDARSGGRCGATGTACCGRSGSRRTSRDQRLRAALADGGLGGAERDRLRSGRRPGSRPTLPARGGSRAGCGPGSSARSRPPRIG